jgi:16S rRNA processing protein RimM
MVVMGRIAAPFGVQGWIKVQTFTETLESLLGYAQWWVGQEQNWQCREVEDAAVHGQVVIAKLRGCDDRDAAAGLKGAHVAVPREALPDNAPGEYYWADLHGLKVRNLQGEELGTVSHLLATGANGVLVVQGERERLIPFVAAYVVAVDLAHGELVVDWGADF